MNYRLVGTYLIDEEFGDDTDSIREKAINEYESLQDAKKDLKALIIEPREAFEGLTKVEVYSNSK